jgi:hypothetical protein
MKNILLYLTERLVLSKTKHNNFITLEDYICWFNGYDSIDEWTVDEYNSFPYSIMSEECLTKKCHDNLSELYEYIIENLDVLVDISNPKYDGQMYVYTAKIGKYIFELLTSERYN